MKKRTIDILEKLIDEKNKVIKMLEEKLEASENKKATLINKD